MLSSFAARREGKGSFDSRFETRAPKHLTPKSVSTGGAVRPGDGSRQRPTPQDGPRARQDLERAGRRRNTEGSGPTIKTHSSNYYCHCKAIKAIVLTASRPSSAIVLGASDLTVASNIISCKDYHSTASR